MALPILWTADHGDMMIWHDMMTWQHDDMTTWWHDMIWWHDDMTTWWHDMTWHHDMTLWHDEHNYLFFIINLHIRKFCVIVYSLLFFPFWCPLHRCLSHCASLYWNWLDYGLWSFLVYVCPNPPIIFSS